jgi:hypothetical protein
MVVCSISSSSGSNSFDYWAIPFSLEAFSELARCKYIRSSALLLDHCYGALAMYMIGCAGPPTPRQIRIYHILVVTPAFLANFALGPSATVLQ